MKLSNNPTRRSLKLKWQLHMIPSRTITNQDLEIYNQDVKNLKQRTS
jgi:hypothetical protein